MQPIMREEEEGEAKQMMMILNIHTHIYEDKQDSEIANEQKRRWSTAAPLKPDPDPQTACG